MNNILITSAGRRVSLVEIFKLELKKIDKNGRVLAVDCSPNLSSACQVSDGYSKVPKIDDENYVRELLKYCLKEKVNLLIPTIDTELVLLSKNKNLFLENNINPIISSEKFIKKCRNKRLIHDFFRSRGIDTAKEYKKSKYNLPLFIKPIDGSNSVDNFLVKSENDFIDYHFENQNLMFLEYIDKTYFSEFTCDLYYGKDNLLKCVIPRKRIQVRSGEVSKAETKRNKLVKFIEKHLGEIEGARGCVTAQFFMSNNSKKIYGIEVNPRFGGGYPLSYHAGGNYVKWILHEYLLDQPVKSFDGWEDKLRMLRYDKEIIIKNNG